MVLPFAVDQVKGDVGEVLPEFLKEVEDRLSQDLQARAGALNAEAMSALYFFLGVSILAVLVVGVVAFFIIRGIVRPIAQAVACTETLRRKDIARLGTAIEEMARGELAATVEVEAQHLDLESKDEVGVMVQSLNGILTQTHSTIEAFEKTQSTLKEMLEETHGLVESAKAGQLEKRADATGFQGGYAELVGGINETLDAIIAPINEAADVLEQVAARDLRARVRGDYQGHHARIKEALNTAVQNLDEGMSQVGGATVQVGAAASQISSGSQSLAEGVEVAVGNGERERDTQDSPEFINLSSEDGNEGFEEF